MRRPFSPTPRAERTFGYYGFEILAAAFKAILLFPVAVYILYEAYVHMHNLPEIRSGTMLFVAAFGLVVNIISMRLLSGGKDSSLNVKGTCLKMWSDMLGSIWRDHRCRCDSLHRLG